MQLVEGDVEHHHGGQAERGGEAGPVGTEERVQGSPYPVVVDQVPLCRAEPQEDRVVPRRPRAQAVEGLAAQRQGTHQDPDGFGGGEPAAGAGVPQVAGNQPVKAEAIEDGVDHREARDPHPRKRDALRVHPDAPSPHRVASLPRPLP